MSDKNVSDMTDDEIRAMAGATADRLTDWDRDIIKRARQLSGDDIESAEARTLARELLRQLADLAESLGGQS